MFNLTLWRPAMIAVATVTALAAGGGAAYAAAIPSTAPASTAPGSVIYATGVHAGAAQSIRSSSPAGTLTLKTTDAYAADQTSTNWSGYVTPVKAGVSYRGDFHHLHRSRFHRLHEHRHGVLVLGRS